MTCVYVKLSKPSKHSNYKDRLYRRTYVIQCDQCFVIFERRQCFNDERGIHFCSTKCAAISRGSGLLSERIKSTCIEKYGVDHVFKSSSVIENIKSTCIDHYGVDWASKSDIMKDVYKKTCLERYGVKSTLQLPQSKAKNNTPLAHLKRFETMKRDGMFGKSNAEDAFYELLCKKFGIDNVERQKRVNGWNIDFYIKTTNTYIQFDGSYWHGLDRHIEEIKKFKHPRDKVIYETMLRVKAQNEWFMSQDMRLERIIDVNVATYF